MNALTIAIGCAIWFYLGYRLYGSFIADRLANPDNSRPTPAHTHTDGVDYLPGRPYLVWGNHFASIAGAGPIIGPILAVSYFGWGPTLIWVLVGSVFLGAVHDYLCLIYSVRNEGRQIYELSESALGRTARLMFAALLYFMLLLLITVFMVSVAQAFINVPALVIPTFGLVAVAMLMGLAVYRLHLPEVLCSVLGVLAAYALIWVGHAHPISLPATWGDEGILAVWFILISSYCLLASVAPMWLLLQPRDFLSSVKLGVGMLLGFAGIAIIHPAMTAPFAQGLEPTNKPLWPILFILVACGAISGFHALVATGTTSKQLDRETDAKPIAFGGMIMEGALSMLVILIVTAGLKWGFAPSGAADPRAWFGSALAENWIVAFGSGFGRIVGDIGIPGLTTVIAGLLGAVMVKSFILTTLDSGTRLARFLIHETLGRPIPLFKGKIAASLAVLVPAYILAVTNSYKSVWQMFGTANQLTAGVALITLAALLARDKRPTRYVMIPALFMLATTSAALVWEMFAPTSGFFTRQDPEWSLGVISLALVALSVAAFIGGIRTLRARAA